MKGSVRRRSRNSWEITVDVGVDPQGRRLRRYFHVKGRKAEAERKLREMLTALDKGVPVDTSKITVSELLDRWYSDYVVPNTKPRTAESYEVIIRVHLKPHLGLLQLAKLQALQIQAMESALLRDGKSAKTVLNVHRVLREALEQAMRWGLIWRNTAQLVDPPRPEKSRPKVPSPAEVWRILALAKETPYYPACHFMAFTGCRRGECLGLKWGNVDLDKGIASIVETVQRVKGRGLIFDTPKSASSRRAIALDSEAMDVMRTHRLEQLQQRLLLGNRWDDFDLVFPGPFGRPLDPSVLTHTFEGLTKKAGVKGVRLHDLRHFHASLLLQMQVHPKVVQERLGHATISITLDTYSHLIPSM